MKDLQQPGDRGPARPATRSTDYTLYREDPPDRLDVAGPLGCREAGAGHGLDETFGRRGAHGRTGSCKKDR